MSRSRFSSSPRTRDDDASRLARVDDESFKEKRREKQKKQKQVTGRLLFGPLSLRCSVVYGFTRARGKRTLAQRIACGVVKAVSFPGRNARRRRADQKTKKPKNPRTAVRAHAPSTLSPRAPSRAACRRPCTRWACSRRSDWARPPRWPPRGRAARCPERVIVRHHLDLVRDGHERERLRDLAVQRADGHAPRARLLPNRLGALEKRAAQQVRLLRSFGDVGNRTHVALQPSVFLDAVRERERGLVNLHQIDAGQSRVRSRLRNRVGGGGVRVLFGLGETRRVRGDQARRRGAQNSPAPERVREALWGEPASHDPRFALRDELRQRLRFRLKRQVSVREHRHGQTLVGVVLDARLDEVVERAHQRRARFVPQNAERPQRVAHEVRLDYIRGAPHRARGDTKTPSPGSRRVFPPSRVSPRARSAAAVGYIASDSLRSASL